MDITGNRKAKMEYSNYQRDIVEKYSISLEGWSHPTWGCLSKLSNNIGLLEELLLNLRRGTCRWVKLTPAELKEKREQYERAVAAGEKQAL